MKIRVWCILECRRFSTESSYSLHPMIDFFDLAWFLRRLWPRLPRLICHPIFSVNKTMFLIKRMRKNLISWWGHNTFCLYITTNLYKKKIAALQLKSGCWYNSSSATQCREQQETHNNNRKEIKTETKCNALQRKQVFAVWKM